MLCEICGNPKDFNRYICSSCFKKHANSFWNLKPSTVKNKLVQDVFPEIILNTMPDYLKKDVDEALTCLYQELWTALVLMSARMLESELKNHINVDLNIEKELNSIGECIKILEDETNYEQGFLDILDELREIRNNGMHGAYRFSPKESMDTFRKVFQIILWIYNII